MKLLQIGCRVFNAKKIALIEPTMTADNEPCIDVWLAHGQKARVEIKYKTTEERDAAFINICKEWMVL